ncbi:MAG: hypothetical protein ACXWWD_01455 [Chitinophagaceae bacterium]
MKKPQNQSNKMENSAIAITATLAESRMLTNLVEKLAVRRYDTGYCFIPVQPGWQAIEASSIEAHVSGVANLSTMTDSTNVVFTTCFLFTCTKAKGKEYNLTWVNSLS